MVSDHTYKLKFKDATLKDNILKLDKFVKTKNQELLKRLATKSPFQIPDDSPGHISNEDFYGQED